MSNDSIKTQIPGIPDYDSSKTKRCFFKIDKRNYGNINNAELQEQGGEIPKEIKCVCDGSAEKVNACLANMITVINNISQYGDQFKQDDSEFLRNIGYSGNFIVPKEGEGFDLILRSKGICARKGMDYLAEIKGEENATSF